MEHISLLGLSLIEWIGYVSSVIVLVSLSLSSLVKLRIYNLIGASLFSFYGFYIGSLPVGIMNLAISLFDIYYLRVLLFKNESFDFIEVNKVDPFLKKFMQYFEHDIHNYFPDFSMHTQNEKYILMALRDMNVAGVFVGLKPKNGVSEVILDYVTPQFRDNKTGRFIFRKFKEDCLQNEIKHLKCVSDNLMHIKYLKRNGFQKSVDGKTYILPLS